MESTLIQVLHLFPDSTIDQPSTVVGKQWRRAIDYLVGCTGVSENNHFAPFKIVHNFTFLTCIQWETVAWGHHHESPIHLTLITGFKTSTNAQTFLSTNYPTFLGFLRPILASPPSRPGVTSHLSVMNPDTVTTISKLTFSNPFEGDGGGIIWKFKWYANELKKAAKHETGSLYTGVTRSANWDVVGEETAEKGKIRMLHLPKLP